MDEVIENASFKHDMDAAKFAFALAIDRGYEPAQAEGAKTIWNVETLIRAATSRHLFRIFFRTSIHRTDARSH
jgi:hypothetical protein